MVMKSDAKEDRSVSARALSALSATRWSVVARAGDRGGGAWTEALETIARSYRPVFVRHLTGHMRIPPDQAEDLVQAFLLEKVLEKNVIRLASAKQGRFRSFFMKTFCNFVASQLRRQQARKRAPDHRAAERVEDHPELVAPDSAQKDAFDALWARQVLSAALERMRRECEAQGRTTLWRLFETRILAPLLDGETPVPYGILVRRFGLRSPSEASNLLITARRMFVRNLKAVVGETVADDRCVDAEILALKRALSK